MPDRSLQSHQCHLHGRPADDCDECDDLDEDEESFEAVEEFDPRDAPCRRCRARPCSCTYVCDHCGNGTSEYKLRRAPWEEPGDASTDRLCGRCAEFEWRRWHPRNFWRARSRWRGERGTPRQRRLYRLHQHQRRCSDCGLRCSDPACTCIPF